MLEVARNRVLTQIGKLDVAGSGLREQGVVRELDLGRLGRHVRLDLLVIEEAIDENDDAQQDDEGARGHAESRRRRRTLTVRIAGRTHPQVVLIQMRMADS